MKEDLFTFFGIAPSHQSIKNWLGIDDGKRIKSQIANYTGYYCYDEQYIEIGGRKKYRLTLFDSILNIPVSEEIAENSAYKTVYGPGKPIVLYNLESKGNPLKRDTPKGGIQHE